MWMLCFLCALMKTAKWYQSRSGVHRCVTALAALALLAGCTPNLPPPGQTAVKMLTENAKTRRSEASSRSPSRILTGSPPREQCEAGPPPAPLPPQEPPPSEPPPPPLPAEFATEGTIPEQLKAQVAEARRKRVVRNVGIAVVDLAHGQAYGVAPHRIFRPASVIKLAVMVEAFQAAPEMPPKTFDRLRPDIRRMIVDSDNPSTTRLVRRLGRARINTAMRALGLPGIALQPRQSPRGVLAGSQANAAEVALLLARLARREVVSPPASEEMLLLLGAQHRRNRIPAGLTAQRGVWVGNKTGTLPGLVHDAGIVIDIPSGIAYTLAIFTEGAPSERAGERLCAALSAEVYRLLRGPRAFSTATEDPQR
jgi:beta-lactamase class A